MYLNFVHRRKKIIGKKIVSNDLDLSVVYDSKDFFCVFESEQLGFIRRLQCPQWFWTALLGSLIVQSHDELSIR